MVTEIEVILIAPAFSAVQKLTGRFFIHFFDLNREESDKTPPNKREDVPPDYDVRLGLYEMGPPQRITIYKKAIESEAKKLGCPPEHLKHLVDIHEWGHALHHLGSFEPGFVSKEEFMKSRNSERYSATSEALKEQIAQLSTLLTMRESTNGARSPETKKFYEELENTFFDLMSRQSKKYKLPDFVRAFTSTELERIPLTFEHSLHGERSSCILLR